MTIKQHGGVFGRNPAFNNVEVENDLTVSGDGQVNGDLGLGTAPSYRLDVIDSSAVPVAIRRDGSDGDALQIFNGSIFGTKCLGFGVDGTHGVINNQFGQIQLWTSSNKIATLTISGLAMENGKGIDFSATSGTGTSELFDDYEEGTWTPTLIGATSGSMSFGSVALARYTKVGRIVSITLYMTGGDFAAHTVSGNVLIQGLPYAASSAGAGVISVAFCNLTTADEADITVSGYVEATSLRLLKGSSTTAITGADLLSSGTNGAIMLSIVYETGA